MTEFLQGFYQNILSIDLAQMDYFFKVAQCGSITRAAAELNATQSTVSRAIQSLEKKLDLVLFIRSPQGAALTPAGRVLRDEWERAMEMVVRGWEMAHNLYVHRHAQINVIDYTFTHKPLYLLPILERFERRRPDVIVQVRQVERLDPHALEQGLCDFAFLPAWDAHRLPGNLRTRTVAEAPLELLARREHPVLKSPFSPRALASETLLLGLSDELEGYTRFVLDACAQLGVKPQNPLYCSSLLNMQMALMRGKGVMLGSRFFTLCQLAEIDAVPVGGVTDRILLAWRGERDSSSFRDFLQCAPGD